ncbi:MAG: radical SAM/SPASM domain-containing protein [Nanobdellota archaeon]
MLKDLFVITRLLSDRRNHRLLKDIHKEFSADKDYRFINLLKALWHVSKDEKIVRHENAYITTSFLPPIPSKAFDQVCNAVPGTNTKFYEHTHAIRKAPISMFIAITGRCNYNCWHCSKANRQETHDLPLDTIKRLINDIQDMGTAIIGLTGGEPSLRKDLPEIISTIDERSISTVFTTGQGLTRKRATQLKQAGLYSVGISLDHYDKKTFDKLRSYDGAYDIALKAIEHCKQAGLYTMIQCVATKEMIATGEVWKMIKLAKRLDVHEIRFLESMPTGKLINLKQEDILTDEERKALIKIHKRANWSGRYPKVTAFAHTESHEQFGCGAGTQHSYIDAQGNLYPCDFVPMSFGNIQDQPVSTLWKDMNKTIGKPRDMCMIMETYDKMQSNALPVDPKGTKELCKKCRKMKALPRFYTILGGKK